MIGDPIASSTPKKKERIIKCPDAPRKGILKPACKRQQMNLVKMSSPVWTNNRDPRINHLEDTNSQICYKCSRKYFRCQC